MKPINLIAIFVSLFLIQIVSTPTKADVSLSIKSDGVNININRDEYYHYKNWCKKPWNRWKYKCRWYRRNAHYWREYEVYEGRYRDSEISIEDREHRVIREREIRRHRHKEPNFRFRLDF